MSKPRIAVVGAGVIGQAHIGVIQRSHACALHAVVDPAPAARALSEAAGVPWCATLDELLDHHRPDAVVLATPNALHVPQALRCIEVGLPVLLEKPLATTVAEGQVLVQAVERLGARVLIGHHRAHSPLMALAQQVVTSGQLGQLVAVAGSATFYKPHEYFTDGPWRSAPGGGPILLNMIHEVHNLRMLCGEISAVQAMASNATRGFAVEDTVVINLRFGSGALGSFVLSDTAACARSWEQTSQENRAYAHSDDEDCYVITGTRGSLSVPTLRLKTYARDEDRSWFKPFEAQTLSVTREDPLQRQIEHFASVVRGEATARVSAHDGLQNLRVTEAIAEAARTGQVVTL